MKILVFDTCFNKSYIVLSDNGKILSYEKIQSNEFNYHSAYLIPKIRDILRDNNMQVKDLEAIGVDIGPGSFTGIRAGITIARVLAQQANLKLAGISSMQILSKLNTKMKESVVVLDARKNKVYYAKYLTDKEITTPCLIDKESLPMSIKEFQGEIISDSSIGAFLSENGIKTVNYEENDENIGLFLSDIVFKKLTAACSNSKSSSNFNWAEVKPLYIQTPSITKQKVKTNV